MIPKPAPILVHGRAYLNGRGRITLRIYYDIILNERFGLGQRIDATQIDKWELYRIAQYCDQLVPDGKGGSGTEPRFRCNVYIRDRNDAGPYFVIWRVYFAA